MPDETKPTTDWSAPVEYLRGLAQIVRDEQLTELEIESNGFRITLKGAVPLVAAPQIISGAVATGGEGITILPPVPAYPVSGAAPTAAAPKADASLAPVVSPMVGVFYRAPSPSDPNFVEVGDRVEVGQTIGLVEAMKVFNEITSEISGIVAEIRAESGQLVETGGPLLMLRR